MELELDSTEFQQTLLFSLDSSKTEIILEKTNGLFNLEFNVWVHTS
jgi:hypothetical protein